MSCCISFIEVIWSLKLFFGIKKLKKQFLSFLEFFRDILALFQTPNIKNVHRTPNLCHIATVPAPKCFFNRKLFWSFSELFWLLGKKNVKVRYVMLHIVYWGNLVTKTVFWNKKVEKVVFELLEPFLALFVILE